MCRNKSILAPTEVRRTLIKSRVNSRWRGDSLSSLRSVIRRRFIRVGHPPALPHTFTDPRRILPTGFRGTTTLLSDHLIRIS